MVAKRVKKGLTNALSKGKEYAWRILLIVACGFGVFLIGRPLIYLIKTSIEIRDLNREKSIYEAEIHRDSTLIEQLKNDDFLEQYAREKYFMQGKNEQVFIVE